MELLAGGGDRAVDLLGRRLCHGVFDDFVCVSVKNDWRRKHLGGRKR